MPHRITRERMIEAIRELPEDASVDDAIERLVFLAKIEEGLAQLDRGEGIPHAEVKRRLVAAVERLQQFPESGRAVPERHSRIFEKSSPDGFASCIDCGHRRPWRSQPCAADRAISLGSVCEQH
jgi:predicted transcriptional regulator